MSRSCESREHRMSGGRIAAADRNPHQRWRRSLVTPDCQRECATTMKKPEKWSHLSSLKQTLRDRIER